jgi:DME family drug/metabolite transporter
LALVSLAGVIWGTTGPLVQLTVEHSELAPLTISACRAVAAAVVLNLMISLMGRARRSIASARRHWRRLAVVGVLIAASQLLFFMAVQWAGVSLATVICMGFAPILLLGVSSVRRRRLPSGAQMLTVTMAVAGLLLISILGGGREHADNPALGVVSALGAGACFAFTADVGALLSRRLDAFTITAGIMNVAAIVLVPCAVVGALVGHLTLTAGAGAWFLVALLAVGVVATNSLMFLGLRGTSSAAAVVATLIEPVTAVLIAAAFLGEHLTLAGLVGCLLIVTAIAGLGRFEDETAHPEPHVTPTIL